MSIWTSCQGKNYFQSLHHKPWRVVEAQHILSARDLVDTSEEHDILENLIEQSKPKIQSQKDYLIYTPFRYPPLQYGSRFGSRFEPSLWYGSLELKTALAEVAYYIKKFHLDSHANLSYINTTHTAFNVLINTSSGIALNEPPFKAFAEDISHPNSYQLSQELGAEMRQSRVKAFVYTSARCKEQLSNIAAFEPSVFKAIKEQYAFNQQTWQCIATKESVEFSRMNILDKTRMIF
ncbi:MAG TPA: RES domain-containing protein [Legionellales bacterium]|nr:RES domain-containing protein [Legionellales bacterium]